MWGGEEQACGGVSICTVGRLDVCRGRGGGGAEGGGLGRSPHPPSTCTPHTPGAGQKSPSW